MMDNGCLIHPIQSSLGNSVSLHIRPIDRVIVWVPSESNRALNVIHWYHNVEGLSRLIQTNKPQIFLPCKNQQIISASCTSLPILLDLQTHWAHTVVTHAIWQAHVWAFSVVLATVVDVLRLTLGMIAMQVHGEMQAWMDGLVASAVVLVGQWDAAEVPVGPVDRVLEHGDCEGMMEAPSDDLLAIGTVNVGGLDCTMLGIDPVDAVGRVVDGEAVGPVDVLGYHGRAPGAIHVGALDLWIWTYFGKFVRIYYYSSLLSVFGLYSQYHLRDLKKLYQVQKSLFVTEGSRSWHIGFNAWQRISYFNQSKWFTPISPINIAIMRMNGNSSWLVKVAWNKYMSYTSVKCNYFDTPCTRICPE